MIVMEWYYSKNGTQSGPVAESDLKAMIVDGHVQSNDLVWREGMAEWLPLIQVQELTVVPAATPYQSPQTQAPEVNLQGGYHGESIPTYLWQSIVVTLMCCMPFGIVAIVYAAKVDGYKAGGNIAAAKSASKSASTWCMVSFITGLVVGFLYMLLVVVSS